MHHHVQERAADQGGEESDQGGREEGQDRVPRDVPAGGDGGEDEQVDEGDPRAADRLEQSPDGDPHRQAVEEDREGEAVRVLPGRREREAVEEGVDQQTAEGEVECGAVDPVGALPDALEEGRAEEADQRERDDAPPRLLDGVGEEVDHDQPPDRHQHEAVERGEEPRSPVRDAKEERTDEDHGEAETEVDHVCSLGIPCDRPVAYAAPVLPRPASRHNG